MTYLALLRGINVGGKNSLPMKDLARIFEGAGCSRVRTFIQSGNVIFESSAKPGKIAQAVTAAIEKQFGYRIPVVIRTAEELTAAIQGNPYLATAPDLKALYVYFLAEAPENEAVGGLDSERSAPDAFHVRGREIYLHMPNGMGRTKLTNAYFDAKLSTVSTARNWATILKLAELMKGK